MFLESSIILSYLYNDLVFAVSFPSYFVKIVGSFNGLLCLRDSGTEVTYLWNPSIRKFKRLAVSVSSITEYEWVVTGFSHQ